MIDIEANRLLSEQQKLYYVIYSYSERDAEIYQDTKVNVLKFMYEKSKKYKMIPSCTDDIEDIVAQRRSREFYYLFTLDDLCVLGY